MSTTEYVKYMTVTLVTHFEMPRAERKQMRLQKKEVRRPFLDQCFGLIPISLSMIFRRRHPKIKST